MADLNLEGIAQYTDSNPITINDFPLASSTPAVGVPNPSTTITGNRSSTSSSIGGAPAPKKYQNFEIQQKLLRPALTSHFQCWFNPPQAIRNSAAGQYYLDGGEFISLLCSDASLPGSKILTTEINDDYTGVTERLGYRRSYDNQLDFTFFVDHGRQNGSYNIISFFEEWIRYVAGDTSTAPDGNFFSRARFPDGSSGYRTEMYVQKFERDFQSDYLEYTFVRAYPVDIASMPISYESSQLLKCQVSFTYNRYILEKKRNTLPSIPNQLPANGVPRVVQTSTPVSGRSGFGGSGTGIFATGGSVERAIGASQNQSLSIPNQLPANGVPRVVQTSTRLRGLRGFGSNQPFTVPEQQSANGVPRVVQTSRPVSQSRSIRSSLPSQLNPSISPSINSENQSLF